MTLQLAQGEEQPEQPGPLRARLEKVPPLPHRSRVRAGAWWWATTGAAKLGTVLVRAPYSAVCELQPIMVGGSRLVMSWARWCDCTDYAARITEATKAGAVDKNDPNRLESRRQHRRWLSFTAALLVFGFGWLCTVRWPAVAFMVGAVLVVLCDAVGRKSTTKAVHLPVAARTVLREGVPLTQITRTLLDIGTREGLELGVSAPMRYHAGRQEYEVSVTCLDRITADHLRAFERGIGAVDHSIRCLAPPDGESTTRRLVIRDGDPLAVVPPAPWIPTGARSIADPLDLGVSMTDTPFELVFAGEHIKAVGATGSGKTSWFLRNTIDRLSACRDAVIWGVDLTNGPELVLWRGVIQRRAFNPDDAEQLLDAALAEIDRRAKILDGFAADDDPDNDDITEWCTQLGPALVVVVDEFSTLADYDGKGGRPNLLGKAEQIVRTGRKHWVSLVALAQKTGNDDFGSTTMTTQANTSIALPCSAADAVRLFGTERRDAGWTPHMLQPGTKTERRDAGKCYVESPLHRTPDVYSCYLPMAAGEVKRRARQRIADGLPSLTGRPDAVEAVEVPAALLLLERVFADYADVDRLPSSIVLDFGASDGEEWTAEQLADAVRPHGVETRKARSEVVDGRSVMCYFRADVRRALGAL